MEIILTRQFHILFFFIYRIYTQKKTTMSKRSDLLMVLNLHSRHSWPRETNQNISKPHQFFFKKQNQSSLPFVFIRSQIQYLKHQSIVLIIPTHKHRHTTPEYVKPSLLLLRYNQTTTLAGGFPAKLSTVLRWWPD